VASAYEFPHTAIFNSIITVPVAQDSSALQKAIYILELKRAPCGEVMKSVVEILMRRVLERVMQRASTKR
jgi:hypothetical protein